MPRTPADHPVYVAFVAGFGPDCVVVDDFEADRSLLKKHRWVLEDIGGAIHVLHQGWTLGMAELEDRSFRTEIVCRYTGDQPEEEQENTEAWLDQHMWPTWETRGYERDDSCSPDNGWDADEQLWRLNVVRALSDVEALVAEIKWAADQDRDQTIA